MNGFDSSLVNGLQIIPSWQEYYEHPSGKILGAFHVLLVSPPPFRLQLLSRHAF